MDILRGALLIAATISTGLVTGLFYAFSISVMPALRRADDRTLVDVMQRINKAILNGWFAIGYLGALVFTALAAIVQLSAGYRAILVPTTAALVIY